MSRPWLGVFAIILAALALLVASPAFSHPSSHEGGGFFALVGDDALVVLVLPSR